jgi:DNA polymerase-3 subunit epsilon
LEAAYKYYCKKDLNNAHSAEADTMATYEVLKAQLDKYPELQNDLEYLSNTFNNASNYLDSSRRFLKTEKGIILCFGKYKDHTIEEVIQKDKNYFNWMYQADFGLDTKNVILKLSEQFQFKINK